jgi:hypothetical protein
LFTNPESAIANTIKENKTIGRNQSTGRKRTMSYDEILRIADQYGIKGGAVKLGLTFQCFYHRVLRARSKSK